LFRIKDDGTFTLGIGATTNSTTAPYASVVIGYLATDGTAGNRSEAIAIGSAATGSLGGVAIGGNATTANRSYATCVGYNTSATAANAVVYGWNSSVSTQYGTAIGPAATTSGTLGVTLGSATNSGAYGIVFSADANTPTSSYARAMTAWFEDGVGQSFYINSLGNQVFRSKTALTSGTHYSATATNTLTMHNGTATSTNITDAFQLYSTGGVPAFRTAAGNITTLDGIVSAAVAVASTNKIKITVNGVDYYLLVTTVP